MDADFFNKIRVSNSLDPDQAQHFVRPDLGPNCLHRLSADIAGEELNTTYFLAKTLAIEAIEYLPAYLSDRYITSKS